MNDEPTPTAAGQPRPAGASRRNFLKVAGAAAAGVAASSVGCTPAATSDHAPGGEGASRPRASGFDRRVLDAVGEVMLPSALGADGRAAAVTAFVAWVDGYDPVAEEMHGYGYSDIRYLPPDPAPGWRAQLEGLDTLARRARRSPFAELDDQGRREVLTMALAGVDGDRLPAPLGASHVAVALLSHWASSPEAWNLALGVQVSPGDCRPLDGVASKPLPLGGSRA